MSKKDCIEKLSALLSAVKKKVELVTAGKKENYIFGAGNTSILYAPCFEFENINPVAFLDNDPKKQGTAFLTGGGTATSHFERS